MHARIATFEIPAGIPREVGEKVVEAVRERVLSGDGPAGAQRVLVLADPGNGRAVNVTFFDTAENMAAAESFFEEMNPVAVEGVDPGRRVEVGHFEVMMDQQLPG